MKRLLLVATILLMGCSDPYGSSAKAGADIASVISGGYNTVLQLQQQGTLTAPEAVNVAGYLKFANDADKVFLTCVSAAHTNATTGAFTVCATVFAMQLNSPTETALIHVGNANAQNTINAVISGITTGISTLQAALGGA
jgi:hypothetical protein